MDKERLKAGDGKMETMKTTEREGKAKSRGRAHWRQRVTLWCTVALGGLAVVLGGCSRQEFSSSFPRGKVPKALLTDPESESGKTRSEKFAEVLAEWEAQSAKSEDEDYLVGAGDILEISVLALELPDQTTALAREVSQEGVIALPYIKEVRCLDRTTGEIEGEVRKRYAGGYIRNPEVSVSVKEYKSRTVSVVGAVGRPGVYVLPRNSSTVLALLAEAGGVEKDAGDDLVILRPREVTESGSAEDAQGGKRQEIKVNLRDLLDGVDLTQNVEVRDGDIISVSREEERYVSVLGYVRAPQSFPLRDGERMTVSRALSLAGGLTPASRAENSVLVRRTETGQKAYALDLTQAVRGDGPTIYLEPEDTIIVGSDAVAKFMEVFTPSVGARAGYTMGQ